MICAEVTCFAHLWSQQIVPDSWELISASVLVKWRFESSNVDCLFDPSSWTSLIHDLNSAHCQGQRSVLGPPARCVLLLPATCNWDVYVPSLSPVRFFLSPQRSSLYTPLLPCLRRSYGRLDYIYPWLGWDLLVEPIVVLQAAVQFGVCLYSKNRRSWCTLSLRFLKYAGVTRPLIGILFLYLHLWGAGLFLWNRTWGPL